MKNVLLRIWNSSNSRSDDPDQTEQVKETRAQSNPSPDARNITDGMANLFRAENVGIVGIRHIRQGIRAGKSERNFVSIQRNLTIEHIINLIGQAKEVVPAIAASGRGGPISFWFVPLQILQHAPESFITDSEDKVLRFQPHPRPIAGPVYNQQRLEFLWYHFDRAMVQASNMLKSFPLCLMSAKQAARLFISKYTFHDIQKPLSRHYHSRYRPGHICLAANPGLRR
jgi:hypothetical protein